MIHPHATLLTTLALFVLLATWAAAAQEPAGAVAPSASPSPDRTTEVQALFSSLRDTARSSRFLFGQANAFTLSYRECKHPYNGNSDIKAATGAHPALIESDLMWYDDAEFRRQDLHALREANRLGIVCGFCWHMRGKGTSSFSGKDEQNRKLVRKILADPDRTRNPALDWFLREYETQAVPVFRELGFPLLFRPLHEMNGDWFWWGREGCSPEEYIRLYRLVVTHLRAQGVRNLLFVWSPDQTFDLRYYPGDEFVDVFGLDAYEPGVVDYYPAATFAGELRKLAAFAQERDKLAALTEAGCRQDYPGRNSTFWTQQILPTVKAAAGAGIAYVMTWYNADWQHDGSGTAFVPYPGIESKPGGREALTDFQTFCRDPAVLLTPDQYRITTHSGKCRNENNNFLKIDLLDIRTLYYLRTNLQGIQRK